MGFTVAIVGRPNVGKSTFFNRMMEQRQAIVHDTSGVTRDRQYGISDWNGKTFNVIDTGGFVPNSEDVFEREIRKQVVIAVEEANRRSLHQGPRRSTETRIQPHHLFHDGRGRSARVFKFV